MKLRIKLPNFARAAGLLAVLDASLSSAFAQGSLTPPPGAPGPTMKTLAQIEARTPISSVPFTITQSGSYYLTANLTVTSGDALTIATSGVALDLNGFTISSTAASASGTAIVINGGLKNLTIQNGFIQSGVTKNGSGTYSGPGFGNGIVIVGNSPENVRVIGVAVTGCLFHGIYLVSDSAVVESCTVRTVGAQGIAATTIIGSVATDCGAGAIGGRLISHSRGECTGSSRGISGTTVLNCYAISAAGNGIFAYTAQNCFGYSVSETGIDAYSAQNCYGYGGAVAGISALNAQNCYGVSSTGTGISASTAENCYGQTNGDAYGVYAQSAQNCRGYSATGRGVFADTAENCYGVSGSGVGGAGIFADTAQNCRGSSSNGTGISATTALNCTGYTGSGTAIFSVNAQNCYAYATAGGIGLSAQKTAQNCFGSGAYGITVAYGAGGIATNCHGVSTGNGHGVHAEIAIGCYGESPNGYGVLAIIANCCRGFGSPLGVAANFKYNMP